MITVHAPQVPSAPRPQHRSPAGAKHQEAFSELFARRRPAVQMPVVPPLPGSDAGLSVLLPVLTSLASGVQEIRQEMVTRQDLQEFRDLQQAAVKDMIVSYTAPLQATIERQDVKLTQFEHRMGNLESNGGVCEKDKMRLMNDNDPAFCQIAFTGFKTLDLAKRILILTAFARSHLSPDVHRVCNIESVMRDIVLSTTFEITSVR